MRKVFWLAVAQLALLMLVSSPLAAQIPRKGRSETLAMVGEWRLNAARSHYGGAASRRRREVMACSEVPAGVRCSVTSVHVDGRTAAGRFTARTDGTSAPVTGMQGMDSVRLRRVTDTIVDATFTMRGKPVLGYRMVRSDDGQSLTVISVDPVTREALTSVIVYDRR